MKKKIGNFLVVVLTYALLCSIMTVTAVPTMADDTYGYSGNQVTVRTYSNWFYPGKSSISFNNNKISYTKWSWGKYKTYKDYPIWIIRYQSSDGTDKGTKTMTGKNLKIKLKPNKTYTFTVNWAVSNVCNLSEAQGTPWWGVKGLWKADYN